MKLTLGLDDPYYTGLASLISQIVFIPLNIPKNYHFELTPVYDELAIDYEGHARINFALIQLIGPCLVFVLRKPVRDYLGLFQFKKKKKDV